MTRSKPPVICPKCGAWLSESLRWAVEKGKYECPETKLKYTHD